jgi:hypothetical protein
MATPTCSICLHTNARDIDSELLTGRALVPTAIRFGVSKSAMGRHKLNCLAPKVAAASRVLQPVRESREATERAKAIAAGATPSPSDVLSLTDLVSRLSRSLERLEHAADDASTAKLYSALAAVSGQLHRGVEAAAKLQGLYVEPATPQDAKFSIRIVFPEPARANAFTQLADHQ